MRKLRQICFRDKMPKNLVCVPIQILSAPNIYINFIVFGLKSTPMKWISNILHLICIWVKCAGVRGKITPMKWAVFIKLDPLSKTRMLLSKILPQTSKKFTQIYLPYL